MLSGKYGVHSNCISQWKNIAIEGIIDTFSKSSKGKKNEEEITRDDLLREIGQLKMENEFLKKKYKQINGIPGMK